LVASALSAAASRPVGEPSPGVIVLPGALMLAGVVEAAVVMLAAAMAEAAVPATGGLAVEAAAIAAFAGGGERLPGVGKDPPLCAPS
jgi:hypothetical protein